MTAEARRERATQLICPFASAVVGRRITSSESGCDWCHSLARFSISTLTEAKEKSGFGSTVVSSVTGIGLWGHAP